MKRRKTTHIDPDELKLWKHYAKHQDTPTRNQLAEIYLYLVRDQAHRTAGRIPEITVAEMTSAGALGLFDAINTFRIHQGTKFSTFAVPRIRGAMLDDLRQRDIASRLARSRFKRIDNARETAAQHLGHAPTDEETAAAMGLDFETFAQLERDCISAIPRPSLDRTIGETEAGRVSVLGDVRLGIADPPEDRAQQLDLLKLVTKGCSQNERLILILYYYEEQTMRDIGQTLGLSESRVSQMHSALVSRLKTTLQHRKAEFL
jgi:RNA polymerase sigma factor for flagellar operon FliA